MDRNRLLKQLTFLIIFIFLINFIAGKLYWYTSIWWFDMPMHFLGGFWIGLALLWLFSSETLSFRLAFKIIFGGLIIGIGWEIFEVLVNHTLAQNSFNALDTISDVFFDLGGGSLAILYFIKRIMKAKEITV